MKNLTDFLRKTVKTSVDPRLQCSSLPHVFSQRPKLTGSGLFAIFGSGSCQFSGQVVSIRALTLSIFGNGKIY